MGAMAASRGGCHARLPLLTGAGMVATVCLVVYIMQDSGICATQNAAFYLTQRPALGSTPGGDARRQQEAAACPAPQEVQSSAWAQSCYLVTKACVDRGMIVLFDDKYQPALRGGGEKPPQFAAEQNYGQYIYFYRNGYGEYMYPLDTIRSRPASADEGADYLRSPVFSNCTVPVVWYPFWMTNFGHFFRDNAAKLFGFVEDTPWAASLKLVPMTAEGLALPGFNYALLQTMSPQRVETWADFSTRLPSGSMDLFQPGPPPSMEGSHQRCFESMFVCTHGLNISRWPLHGFGQHVVQSYRHLLQPEVQELVGTASSVVQQRGDDGTADGSTSSRDSSITSSHGAPSKGGGSDGPTQLRVVFQRRVGDTRQLLNIGELLGRCNAWRHRTTTGRQLTAQCSEAEITDLLSGMTAALQADVFVGVHGANLANGWLMRPGASMIEVQPYGFDAHVPHLQDPLFNAQDDNTQVLWWVLMGCDPTAWRPSPAEAAQTGVEASWAKNRNMHLSWEAFDAVLRQVAETGGDMQRYRELWRKGEWWWHVGKDNITFGGHHRSKCSE